MRIARAAGYTEGIVTYTGNLSALALDRKDWASAEVLAREALSLSEDLGRQQLIASNCLRLATALVRQGRTAKEVTPHAQRAVDMFARLRSSELEGGPSDSS